MDPVRHGALLNIRCGRPLWSLVCLPENVHHWLADIVLSSPLFCFPFSTRCSTGGASDLFLCNTSRSVVSAFRCQCWCFRPMSRRHFPSLVFLVANRSFEVDYLHWCSTDSHCGRSVGQRYAVCLN